MLTAIQYLFIQCSTLFLLFTVFYFYRTGKVQIILFCFMVFNPLFLHLGNMVSSDGFFLALSMTWFALLLWIIHQPSRKIIIWHAVVLFIAFTVRYNAMIYPAIAILAFYLSKLPLRQKLMSIGLPLLLCGWFVGVTMYQYKRLTGYWQYSPFSGWQLANNALYAFRKVDSADRKPIPKKFFRLDTMVRGYFDLSRRTRITYASELGEASTFYMWSKGLPLMDYRDSLFKEKDTNAIELKKWASMGPLYKEYGLFLIKEYSTYFVAHFMWPNARKYYAPPIEFLEWYNGGIDKVDNRTKKWFGYSSTTIKTRMKNPETWVLDFYPILSGVINLVMLLGLLYYIILKGWQYLKVFNKTIIMGATVWLLNAGFTIFASSAALRFQSFPVLLTTIFSLLLVDWLIQLMRYMNRETICQSESNTHLSEHITA
ncbi:hypothetical protein [Niastella yeongjuensis]|uniref:hypothetical protein n=1 Tax=Niastella yeongjuensis TaxID=354355 RepID=UPI001056E136|nr:hypothetical protein [Niastella yeongjuensis]